MVKVAKYRDLIVGELGKLRLFFEFIDAHYFYCEVSRLSLVFCFVDVAILTGAYLFLQDIIFDLLIHLCKKSL